jgi:fumarylacetoacetase
VLVDRSEAEMLLPAAVGDYTDFYASVFHATNVGRMMRPDNPLLPNYKYIPIGYHGRASSLVVSGTPVSRPAGQTEPKEPGGAPAFGPSRSLDYELEVGAFVAEGNPRGRPIPLAEADRHLFGLVLVNDWSARDVQKWEYQPLGPFLAKSFATSVSPWVVTREALAPFRVPAFVRPPGDPAPLPYLLDERDRAAGGFDLRLEVLLSTPTMRERGLPPALLSESNLRVLYWTLAQMLAHHTSNGCTLRPGDLLASGTVSGPEKNQRGCLLELTWRGAEPVELPSGETRRFLEDGDEVILRGRCEREGFVRIGFGECRGVIGG